VRKRGSRLGSKGVGGALDPQKSTEMRPRGSNGERSRRGALRKAELAGAEIIRIYTEAIQKILFDGHITQISSSNKKKRGVVREGGTGEGSVFNQAKGEARHTLKREKWHYNSSSSGDEELKDENSESRRKSRKIIDEGPVLEVSCPAKMGRSGDASGEKYTRIPNSTTKCRGRPGSSPKGRSGNQRRLLTRGGRAASYDRPASSVIGYLTAIGRRREERGGISVERGIGKISKNGRYTKPNIQLTKEERGPFPIHPTRNQPANK